MKNEIIWDRIDQNYVNKNITYVIKLTFAQTLTEELHAIDWPINPLLSVLCMFSQMIFSLDFL